jgi:hypothetical protein
MEHGPARIGDILLNPRRAMKAPSSERAELIGKITDAYNRGEKNPKFRRTYAAMGVRLAHVKTSDLYALFKECEAAQSFGKLLNWKLNPKNCNK